MRPKKIRAAVIVAHPDDETLFFGGLMLQNPAYEWHVICVTDGNFQKTGPLRQIKLFAACEKLGVRHIKLLNYEDRPDKRIDVKKLTNQLASFGPYHFVFSHGPLGEYGHIQHQDVSYATHQAFYRRSTVYSVAYNVYPHLSAPLNSKEYKIKSEILLKIYKQDLLSLLRFLPNSAVEAFVKVSKKESESIYESLTMKKNLDRRKLRIYKILSSHIEIYLR